MGTGGRSLPPDDALVVRRADVLSAPISDGLILLDREQSRAHLLNSSGRLIWTGLDGQRDIAALGRHLADVTTAGPSTGPAADEIVEQVRQAVAHLLELGLAHLVGFEPTGPGPDLPAGGRVHGPGLAERIAELSSSADVVGAVVAAGTSVLLWADHHDVGSPLAAAVATLPPAGDSGSAAHLIEVRSVADGSTGFHVLVDGVERVGCDTAAMAVDVARAELNRLAIEFTPGHVLIHGGAAECGGLAVVIAGSSGSGKSTLTAALVQSGLAYLGDELVSIGPDADVLAYPKPLDLSPESCQMLAINHQGSGRKSWVSPLEFGAVGGPARVKAMILLDAEDGSGRGADALELLEPGPAAVALLPNVFGASFDSADGLAQLARLVEVVPVYRMGRLPLEQAVEVVRSTLTP